MKKRVRIISCVLMTGILLFHSMSVWAVEKTDSEDLKVTAFSYEEEETEEYSSAEEQMNRQLELSEKRADMLATKELAGDSVEAGLYMSGILLGSCFFALSLWLGCRLRFKTKEKRKKEK